MASEKIISLPFIQTASAIDSRTVVEPFQIDIDAVKVKFRNGEEIIVTQAFRDAKKFDLWLSTRDPVKPGQILSSLDSDQALEWLSAISYRILKI